MTTRPLPRTPNLDLRRARQAMRLSQAQFADAIKAAGNAIGAPNHCTKRLVQKWETGEHATCRPEYIRVLQAVTGLSGRELGFQALPEAPEDSATGADVSGAGAVSSSADGGQDASAATLAVSLLKERSSYAPLDGAMDRLRYALEHPAAVDARAAEFVELATARLFDLEHHSPAQLLAPTVDRHLATVTALLTTARHEAVRRSLLASAGQSALLAAWLAFDRGDVPSSHRFWNASSSAAQVLGAPALLAGTLTCQSYEAARRHDPATAWQLAHTATERTPDDPRATAWATARAGLYAAQLGERIAATAAMRDSLEIAEKLPDPTPGDGTTPWTRSFDHAALFATTAHTAALIKHEAAADFAAEAIKSLGTARVKSRAITLAQIALTAAHIGDFDLCFEWGSAAAALARDLDASLALDLLREVVPVLLPYSDTRAVRDLLPQLAKLTLTTDQPNETQQEG